ncbi:MAG: DNRLRE domain-containing protein, partial [Dysgonamonadaceae bacterium]|nr:DNRLRE domain-containing protein [Dysgonamonadaceae bacterium]
MKTSILLLAISLLSVSTQGQTIKKLYPTDDTYVTRGDNSHDLIRGIEDPNSLKIYTHQSDEGYSYKTYLKFNLQEICSNPDLIRNAGLKLVGKEDQGAYEHYINISTVPNDDAWAEDNLTFRNRNIAGTPTFISFQTKTVGKTDVEFIFDIADKIREYKAAGKSRISLMLSDNENVRNPSNNRGSIITCYSKEAFGNNAPCLTVEEEDVSSLLLTDIKIN